MGTIAVIIPSLEPDSRLTDLLRQLRDESVGPVVLVDDGSAQSYQHIFTEAEGLVSPLGGVVLHHEVNMGKGRALKDAFRWCLGNIDGLAGCVTADSDGQHTVVDIKKVRDALVSNPGSLVLGSRDFDVTGVPGKSVFGNKMTRVICGYLSGVKVSDTQTGLRGIPAKFMRTLLDVKGDRFEFETRMLVASKDVCPILEVPIQTVYDSQDHHSTHFRPVKDSLRIYSIFAVMFGKFLFSSLSSSAIDLALFALLCGVLRGKVAAYVAVATVCARLVSATYNYLVNYSVVFHSKSGRASSLGRYTLLAVLQGTASALLTTCGAALLPMVPEVVVKAMVDVALFFVSYWIQREYVYR